jgi:hypothetical protein
MQTLLLVGAGRSTTEGGRASPTRQPTDDSGDDNADDNRAPAALCGAGSRRTLRGRTQGCVLLEVKWAPALIIAQDAGLPPRDRNE